MRPPTRFSFGAVLGCLILVVGSFALRQYWQPEQKSEAKPILASMDFEARDLSVRRYDPKGTVGFDLWAPRAERQRAEDALKLIDANFVLADRDGDGSWHGQAPQALVRNDGGPLQLLGGVMLERPTEHTVLMTENMSIDPQQRRAWGETQVRLEQPGAVVEGGSFAVDLSSDRVALDNRIRGRFSPEKRNQE